MEAFAILVLESGSSILVILIKINRNKRPNPNFINIIWNETIYMGFIVFIVAIIKNINLT